MKNLLLTLFSVLFMTSCTRDEEEAQHIDQILNIYVKDATDKDLINPRIPGSFTSVQFFDLLAETDLRPVTTLSLLKDKDTVTYIDYTAGATRLLDNTTAGDNKNYYSEMLVRFSKTENSQTITNEDTIKIEYNWTPQSFQVSKMWHSNQLVFTKEQGKPNIIKLVK